MHFDIAASLRIRANLDILTVDGSSWPAKYSLWSW